MCGATYAGGHGKIWENMGGPSGDMGDSPEGSPRESAPLHSVPPAGGGSAYAGSLAPALRENDTHPDGGEDPPRGWDGNREKILHGSERGSSADLKENRRKDGGTEGKKPD